MSSRAAESERLYDILRALGLKPSTDDSRGEWMTEHAMPVRQADATLQTGYLAPKLTFAVLLRTIARTIRSSSPSQSAV